jgi:hypothetical protein
MLFYPDAAPVPARLRTENSIDAMLVSNDDSNAGVHAGAPLHTDFDENNDNFIEINAYPIV